MSVRFEDHPGFQRAALWSAAGGAALGAFGMLPLAVAGSAAGLSIACACAGWRNRILAAGACAASAILWMVAPQPWSAWACGATVALLLAAVRAGCAHAAEIRAPSAMVVALAVVLCAAAVALGSEVLPAASAAIAKVVPGWIAASLSGGVLGLWTAACAAPLHLAVARDALEGVGEDLQRQCAELAARAEGAKDGEAKDSYLRAAETLSAEIEKYLRIRA
jgi:hypothetical protein